MKRFFFALWKELKYNKVWLRLGVKFGCMNLSELGLSDVDASQVQLSVLFLCRPLAGLYVCIYVHAYLYRVCICFVFFNSWLLCSCVYYPLLGRI